MHTTDASAAPAPQPSPERLALGLAAGVTAAAAGLAVVATLFMAAVQRSATPAPAHSSVAASVAMPAPGPRLDSAALARGRDAFAMTCAVCHGEDGLGRPGLGRNLATSGFIAKCSDGYISAFLEKGRAADDPQNLTKVAMPPKGGNPDLTPADLADIVVYLRGLQDPRRVEAGVSLLARVEIPEEPEPPAAVVLAASDEPAGEDEESDEGEDDWYDAETLALGAKMYKASCVSCHGPDGKGLKNLGKDLVNSRFFADADDESMLAFLKKGRPASDPANTTKIDMPPKGGNPALNDEKMEAIIAHIRELQRKASTSATTKS